MSATSARQSQRILIDAPVELTLQGGALGVPARALDLSEGGMRLRAEASVQVGDEVTCSLELDDEKAALSGHVRWSKPAAGQAGASGIGVQFGPLPEHQLGLLRRWLADHAEHAELVLVHLAGLREPLRARGCVSADGLQLIATMPDLAPGSELEFQLGEHGSRRSARLERVDVKSDADKGSIELALRLQPSATARSRRNLVYGLGEAEGPEPAPAAAFAAGAPIDAGRWRAVRRRRGRASRRETIEIPKRSTARVARRAGALFAAALASVGMYGLLAPDPEADSATDRETSTAASVTAAEEREPPRAAAASATTQVATANAPPAASPEDAPWNEPSTVEAAPEPETAEAALSPSVAPAASEQTTVQDEARLPALNSFGSKSEIFVPMQGSLNGLRSTQWTEPLAVVLDLPNARIDAPELLRGLRGGGVRRVRLDESRPVPRLQIFLNTVAARFAARSVPHGLLVVLEHDLRPMPH